MLHTVLAQLKSTELFINKGDSLFLQGDAVVIFYYLKQGKIKLIKNTIEGDESLVHVALSHETFAEASLFSNQYHCSAIALTDSNVISYQKQDVLQCIEQNPAHMKALLKIFSQQVRDLRTINEIKNIHSAKDRILAFIRNEMDSNQELALKISFKDTAYKIGLAHETFYRELKKLEKEQLLIRHGNVLKLL